MKLPVWNLTLSTNHRWENQHSVRVKPAGTGLALEEADTPDSPTDMALKGYFNDTEKLVLTFYQQQFSPWYWQTGADPPGLLGNQGPRFVKCLQDIWPRLRCRLVLPEIQPIALAFEDPTPIKNLRHWSTQPRW